jgi:hypothetical protein
MSYAKADVETRYENRRTLPCVNVKVYAGLTRSVVDKVRNDNGGHDGFTLDWMEDNEERLRWTFESACEMGWETLQQDAEEIFGKGVKVWSAGRSGGWAVVEGLPDVESWDAIALARWRKFEKFAKAEAADVPYRMADLAYINVYEAEHAEAIDAYVADVTTTHLGA